jgi:hypothetical protein
MEEADKTEAVSTDESNEELAKWITGELKEAKKLSSEWRKSAKECYSFYSSDQWSDEDKAILEEQGRPPVVFNRVTRTINAIAGLEVQNRQEVRYIPREIGDNAKNEVLTAAAKWARDNCDAEDEESEAFQDVLIAGMGWTDTELDYESDPDGEITIGRDDPLYYFWDAKSKKRNLDDRRWCAKVIPMSEKDVKDRWPGYELTEKGENLIDEDEGEPNEAYPPFYEGDNKPGVTKKVHEIVKFQWYEKESYYRVLSNSGNIVELDEDKYQTLKPAIEGMGLKSVPQKRKVYKCAYLCGDKILEVRDLEVQTGFTMNCITGMRDRNKGMWFGLVQLMLDPQRWANKWLSQIMHILNSNSKGGLLAEKDAFDNPRKAESEWAEPNSITWTKPGAIANGKIKEKTISQMPTGIEGLLRYALESINDVPGVNSELLGLAERQQAGVLEAYRKQAGVTMLAVIFDSLRRYRKEQGRVLAEMIVEYIADGRLIRIVGEKGAEVIPLLKDPLMFKYDVVVDDAPTSPNMKERTYQILQQLLPQMIQAGAKVPPEIMDYLPLPDSLIQKFKEGMQPDPQMQAMQQQLDQIMRQLAIDKEAKSNAKIESETKLNEAKTVETYADAGRTQMEAMTNVVPFMTPPQPMQMM